MDVAAFQEFIDSTKRVSATESRAESVAVFGEISFEDRLDHVHNGSLDSTISHRGNSQGTSLVRAGFGDVNATN